MDLANYPHIFPPPGFIPVNRVGSFIVPPSSTVNVLLNSPQGDLRIFIPNNFDGYLSKAGIVLDDYSQAVFSLTQDGSAIRDYTRLTGPLQAPETPADVLLKLQPSQPLDIQVVNNDPVAPRAVRWRLFGWYYKLSS